MPTVRSSFTPNGQNFEIPKLDFCDLITSVLYTTHLEVYCIHEGKKLTDSFIGVRNCYLQTTDIVLAQFVDK